MDFYNSYNQDLLSTGITVSSASFALPQILALNTSSGSQQSFIFTLENIQISQDKIVSRFDIEFSEFLDQSTSTSSNTSGSISEPEITENPITLSIDQQMTRDAIVDLRIQLKEGDDESEFSDSFPFEKK